MTRGSAFRVAAARQQHCALPPPPIVTSRNKKCSGAAARALTGRRIMSDFLLQLLSIVRAPWAFTAAGRVRLLEKVTLAAPDAFAACGVRD